MQLSTAFMAQHNGLADREYQKQRGFSLIVYEHPKQPNLHHPSPTVSLQAEIRRVVRLPLSSQAF
jgi:hypothetical protein